MYESYIKSKINLRRYAEKKATMSLGMPGWDRIAWLNDKLYRNAIYSFGHQMFLTSFIAFLKNKQYIIHYTYVAQHSKYTGSWRFFFCFFVLQMQTKISVDVSTIKRSIPIAFFFCYFVYIFDIRDWILLSFKRWLTVTNSFFSIHIFQFFIFFFLFF